MDKVYVLIIRDISDGTLLTDEVHAFKNLNNAKKVLNDKIKEYLNNNNFKNYEIKQTDISFHAWEKENSIYEHITIDIVECKIND